MKVNGRNINVIDIYKNNSNIKAKSAKKNDNKYDSIEISKEGLELAKYVAIARNVPDVRYDKVNDIKMRIENGTYKVSSEHIASKIMQAIKEER